MIAASMAVSSSIACCMTAIISVLHSINQASHFLRWLVSLSCRASFFVWSRLVCTTCLPMHVLAGFSRPLSNNLPCQPCSDKLSFRVRVCYQAILWDYLSLSQQALTTRICVSPLTWAVNSALLNRTLTGTWSGLYRHLPDWLFISRRKKLKIF